MDFDTKDIEELCNHAWLNDDNTLTLFGRKVVFFMAFALVLSLPKNVIMRYIKK